MSIQNTSRNWEKLILEHETSGLTQKEFCHQNDIKIDAFKYHRAKHRSPKNLNSKSSFVELKNTNTTEDLLVYSKNILTLRMDFRIQDWFNLEIRLG
jgi:hypothetical protein